MVPPHVGSGGQLAKVREMLGAVQSGIAPSGFVPVSPSMLPSLGAPSPPPSVVDPPLLLPLPSPGAASDVGPSVVPPASPVEVDPELPQARKAEERSASQDKWWFMRGDSTTNPRTRITLAAAPVR